MMDFHETFVVFLVFVVPIEEILGYFFLKFKHFDEWKANFTFLRCFLLIHWLSEDYFYLYFLSTLQILYL